MTLSELIERLTEMQSELGDADPDVTLVTQPNYPLQAHVGQARLGLRDGVVEVWIAEGSHIGYGSRAAWEEGGDLASLTEEDEG